MSDYVEQLFTKKIYHYINSTQDKMINQYNLVEIRRLQKLK